MAGMFPREVKIVYDRNGCIGAAPCVSIDPIDWLMDTNDNKAILISSKKEGERFEKVVKVENEQEMNRVVDSAKVCPVTIIEVWDVKENRKIV